MTSPVTDHHFDFTSHPPERGRSETTDPACSGACCCCCCCCLHTLGGLVGALAYTLQDQSRRTPLNQEELDYQDALDEADGESDRRSEAGSNAGLSVNAIYWLSLLVLTICGLVLGLLLAMQNNNGPNWDGALLFTGFVMLMVLPGVQVLALVVSLVIVSMGAGRGRPEEKKRQLGRLTIGTVIGSVIGLILMCFCCLGLSAIK